MKRFIVLLLMTVLGAAAGAQQVADTNFRPPIEKPAYSARDGPVILIDEAHANFHTATGRYLPFAELLRRDGYVVKPSAARFAAEVLRGARVLVIANAQAQIPPAFTAEEVEAVRNFVAGGGALLLIADHPPFTAAAEQLGKAFGIRYRNAVATDPKAQSGMLVFRRSDGTLMDHPITRGIDQVATFTGCSFELETAGQPLLVFGPEVFSVNRRNDPNPAPLKGHLQGAVLTLGKGRMAAFGEAAMFSAQLSGPDQRPMGMNAPIARQNALFLLNVVHWLTGLL